MEQRRQTFRWIVRLLQTLSYQGIFLVLRAAHQVASGLALALALALAALTLPAPRARFAVGHSPAFPGVAPASPDAA